MTTSNHDFVTVALRASLTGHPRVLQHPRVRSHFPASMPPEGATEACAPVEGDKAPLMGVDEAERVDLVVGPEKAMMPIPIKRRVPIKDAVKVLVFLDMLSVALVVPLLSSYFRDLDIRCTISFCVGGNRGDALVASMYVAFETVTTYFFLFISMKLTFSAISSATSTYEHEYENALLPSACLSGVACPLVSWHPFSCQSSNDLAAVA